MHLLLRETRSLDEAAPGGRPRAWAGGVWSCCRSPMPIWRGLAAAHSGTPSLRLAPLGKLRHPLSVDLVSRADRRARALRGAAVAGWAWIIGVMGLRNWGRCAASKAGLPLAVLPGDGRGGPGAGGALHGRLRRCLRQAGCVFPAWRHRANMARVLGIDGASWPVWQPTMPVELRRRCRMHGVHGRWTSIDRPLAAVGVLPLASAVRTMLRR